MLALVAASAVILSSAPVPDPAPSQVKLASSGFSVLNLPNETGVFYANHFAQQLDFAGVRVVTPQEVAAVIGLERQKQLLGCAQGSESCMAELGDALGVDALITGDLGKIGDSYQLNVKVVSQGGGLLALHSAQVGSEKELLQSLTDAAYAIAPELGTRLGKAVSPRVAKKERRRNAITFSPVAVFLGVYTGEYERTLTSHQALFADFYVENRPSAPFSSQALGFGVGVRQFFGGNAPQGFFASAKISLYSSFERFEVDGVPVSRTGISGGLIFGGGYTWLLWEWLDLSLGLALGAKYGAGVNLIENKPFSGFAPLIEPRISAGVAF